MSKTKDCRHVSNRKWKLIMNSIKNSETIESVLLIDELNAKPFYVPSHDFNHFYRFHEISDSPPLFVDEKQYLKWFDRQIIDKTFYLRIHVCDPMELMRKILIKFQNLNRINCHFFILTKECIEFLVKNYQNLKVINFENSIGIHFNSCVLLAKLKDLKHLNLMGSDIYEESLEVVVKNCQNLKSLNISNNTGITGHCLVLINHSIKRLDLRHCWSIEPEQIIDLARLALNSLYEFLANSGISDNSLEEICLYCPNISNLNISFDSFAYTSKVNDIYGRKLLSERGFSAIGKLKSLHTLTLKHVGKLTDTSLHNILIGCKNLTQLVLNIRHRHQLTDLALSGIGQWCSNLKYFESVHNHFISKRSLISISRISSLVVLILRGNELVDNDVIQVISDCQNLFYLNLDGSNVKNLVFMSCIQKAIELQSRDQLFKASMVRTNIDRSVLYQTVLPNNLRIRVSGPNNLQHFSEFDGKSVFDCELLKWFFPQYWIDFN